MTDFDDETILDDEDPIIDDEDEDEEFDDHI